MTSNKRKSVIISLIMIVVLLLSMGTVWADRSTYEIEPFTVVTYSGLFTQSSATKGAATVQVSISGDSPFITSKIILQSASSGSSSFTNVSNVGPNVLTVYNTKNIKHSCSFPITADKEYRIKVEITDKVNNQTKTITKYENLNR